MTKYCVMEAGRFYKLGDRFVDEPPYVSKHRYFKTLTEARKYAINLEKVWTVYICETYNNGKVWFLCGKVERWFSLKGNGRTIYSDFKGEWRLNLDGTLGKKEKD